MWPALTNRKISWWMLSVLLALHSAAHTFELNCVKGLWQFNGNLSPYWGCQSSAIASGFTINGAPGSHFLAYQGGAHYLDLRSDQSPYNGLQMGEALVFPHAAAANGPAGATRVNNWTVVMDVRIPNVTGMGPLLCHSAINDSCEIIYNQNKNIVFDYANGPSGAGPIASDPLPTATWLRLTFSSQYNSGSGHNILRAYVNGVETAQSAPGALWAPPNGRYGLDLTAFTLFSRASGNMNSIDVNSVAFWGSTLSSGDIASLGASDANGIDWPDMPNANGWPPLPPLNGKLMFGTFEATYTPNMAAIAATATEPSYNWAVADVIIDLGTDGGRIPGMPDHTFGSQITAFIRPDGTAVAADEVAVQHSQPDIAVLGDVTLIRIRPRLTPNGAKCALDLYLPAGFGVNDNAQGAFLQDCAQTPPTPLGANLTPTNTSISLTSAMFGFSPSAPLYPVLDRVPVRFCTAEIAWHPQEGKFIFEQAIGGTAPFYTRLPQLYVAGLQMAAGLPGAAIMPPSNDGYFIASGVPAHLPIIVEARPEGAALIKELTVSLDATALGGTSTGFTTHYPIMSVRWTGAESQIRFIDDVVNYTESYLSAPLPSLTSYRRAIQVDTSACTNTPAAPVPDENIYFDPGIWSQWFFTPDGGLSAYGRLSSTPVFEGQSLTPEWGGFRNSNGTVKFTHAFTTNGAGEGGFPAGYVLTSGTAVSNGDALVQPLPEGQRVASILLTGFFDCCTLIERPGTPEFSDGLADYPGINLRGWSYPSPHTAKSILAGVEINPSGYELDNDAKYCIRPGGISGVHIAAADSGPITFAAYGSEFELTRLILSYRDGANIESGVSGGVNIHAPADFSVIFEQLCLGPKGELESAGVLDGQTPTLGATTWNLKFTPLTLDFPQQDQKCPPPQPGDGFIRIGVSAELPGLGEGSFAGNLAFFDGNIVTESLPIGQNGKPIADGIENVSRFATESLLTITGTPETGGKSWSVNPVTGISVNRLGADATGTLTVGGLLDLPFFVDMPVILSTGSKNRLVEGELPPQLYVRNPWTSLEVPVYDPAHLGHPVNVPLADYRLLGTHDPIATRDWQDLISFALPVKMDELRVIRSRDPLPGQELMLFDLTETVRSMTPDSAEITLDGRSTDVLADLAKQVNVSTLLGNSTLAGAAPEVQAAVDGVLASIRSLDATLADHSHPLLDSGLKLLAQQETTTEFFEALKGASSSNARKYLLDSLVGDDTHPRLTYGVLQMFAATETDPNRLLYGQWRRDIAGSITEACAGLDAGHALVINDGRVSSLAQTLANRMGLPPSLGTPDTKRREAIAVLFSQSTQRLRTAESEMQSGGKLTTALWAVLGDVNTVQPIVQQAINDLKTKWAPSDKGQAYALFYAEGAKEAFLQDLSLALADRFAGSTFAAACGTLLRQYLCDPQTMTRQAFDDTLRMACALVANTSQGVNTIHANGKVHDYLLADNLCGYARICGDSLHELRLDGKLKLQAGDDLPDQKFDGWCLMRDIDSGTPGAAGIEDGGIKAEILAGAATQLDWGTQSAEMTLGVKVGIGANGNPVSIIGDMALVGSIDLCAVIVNNLKFGIGIGPSDAYFYGHAGGKIDTMPIAVGVFFGKTQDIKVLANADRDIASVLLKMAITPPITGALIYGEGQMSLMPILGIPPSCLLDLRVGGGIGYFVFLDSNSTVVGGFKLGRSISGELLCICDITGRLECILAGSGQFGGPHIFTPKEVAGKVWATVEGEVGYDPFSYTFRKSIGILLKANTQGEISWGIDY